MPDDLEPRVETHRPRQDVIDELAEHPDRAYEGARDDAAWLAFAQERVERPSSRPVSWDDAQKRRT
jgi:hypothetical protein